MFVCCISLIIFLIIIVLIILFKPIEAFKNISSAGTWIQRFKELNQVDTKYKDYFKSIVVNDHSQTVFQKGAIFVSVASYRDDQCSDTIRNIAENADYPSRLVIVICQQNDPSDEDCLNYCSGQSDLPLCKQARVEIIRLLHTQARGPVWARHLIQQKWSGEEYYLQIDSHTRLVKSWDTLLINQLEMCGHKAILSQYPLEFDNVPKVDRRDPIKENWRVNKKRRGLYVKEFGPEGLTRIQSDYEKGDPPRHPYPATGWAAGFSFSKGSLIRDVPIDPFLFLFFGEQMDTALRTFTHGYNIFSPTVNVAFHIYERSHRKTFWELNHQKPLEILSRFRLYLKLGKVRLSDIPEKYHFILIGLQRYGLGTERTLEEYEKLAKIDIRGERMI